jgi:hypothetical protein
VITAKQKRAIKRFVAKSDGDLLYILQLLRSEEIGMTNTRRLLDEHPMNRGLKKALKAWAAQWPTRPNRLLAKDDQTTEETNDEGKA